MECGILALTILIKSANEVKSASLTILIPHEPPPHASLNRPAGGGDTTSTSHPSLGHTNNIIFTTDHDYLTLLSMELG
jgi:hypothetical protein